METLETSSNGTSNSSRNGKSSKKDSKHRRYLPTLQAESSIEEMAKVEYSALVDKTPVEFSNLKNYELFSMSPDGLFPMVKISRNKVARLFDREAQLTGGGRCYRVRLSSH